MSLLSDQQHKFDDIVAFFEKELSTIRTGRAVPALVEQVSVETYGTRTPLVHLASITAPDPRSILIQPWDKNIAKDIERAIAAANIGLTPQVDGSVIRLSMPPLSEENRKQLVRVLKQKLEAAKVSLRQIREKIRSEITAAHEAGSIMEDEKFKQHKQLDEVVKKYTDSLTATSEIKEHDIMTI